MNDFDPTARRYLSLLRTVADVNERILCHGHQLAAGELELRRGAFLSSNSVPLQQQIFHFGIRPIEGRRVFLYEPVHRKNSCRSLGHTLPDDDPQALTGSQDIRVLQPGIEAPILLPAILVAQVSRGDLAKTVSWANDIPDSLFRGFLGLGRPKTNS